MDYDTKIIDLNELGLQYLNSNLSHSIMCLNEALLLARCQAKSSSKYKLLAMTYNNLGCYYNAVNQVPRALSFFEKSSKLGNLKGSDAKSTAYAHLNIAAILSKQKSHEKALRHALKSIHYLKCNVESNIPNTITLITAYQLVAAEYIHLDQKSDAKLCYETALELSYKTLGKNHNKSQEISQFYAENFKTNFNQPKNKNSSVIVKRNLTPSHVSNRILKNKVVTYMSSVRSRSLFIKPGPVPKKNNSITYKIKNIDLGYIRTLENFAAIRIQAWWRGVRSRRNTNDIIVINNIKKAQTKAKNAIDEIQQLIGLLSKSSIKGSPDILSNLSYLDSIASKNIFK